jgi:hypothetical protein
MVDSNEWAAIGQVVDRLKQRYPSLSPDIITQVVHQNHARFDDRPLREFVPLFVERGARAELVKLGV